MSEIRLADVRMSDAIVIGIGGNLGSDAEIRERFVRAREALTEIGHVRSAALYRTAPVGPKQPAFLNTAIALRPPDIQPAELLATLHEVERLLGRRREIEARWGPRTIDLDVLLWGSRMIDSPELRVPHPELARRKFALASLGDLLDEETTIPGIGPLGAALYRVREQGCERISETW
jgi:2-amino-4-hydroxy-6-hydroxymethyldihydropteridine diphosphokinase